MDPSSLSLWQEGCMKTVTEEDCENRPNLRRRMGSYVAKPEPQAGKLCPLAKFSAM
jgi:hypothetical protein